MGKYSEGKNSLTVGLSFATNAPLDDRTVVKTKDSLIGLDTWIKPGYLFDGLITAVQETAELYMYIGGQLSTWPSDFLLTTEASTSSASDEVISKYWKKVSSSGLESLSGVFTFKGVAESINEAQIIITLSSATATKGSDTYTVKCQTILYEYDMDIYYGWGATADSILFWTDTPTLTSTSILYGVTAPTSVKKLVLNGEDYYIADRTVPAGDGLSQWENISGKVVYCNETTSKVYSEDLEDPKYELGVAEIVTYHAFDFAPLSASDKYTVSDVASATVAAAGNAGHVYQIGENEYASNGQIWVKLGSPVEDWIIL